MRPSDSVSNSHVAWMAFGSVCGCGERMRTTERERERTNFVKYFLVFRCCEPSHRNTERQYSRVSYSSIKYRRSRSTQCDRHVLLTSFSFVENMLSVLSACFSVVSFDSQATDARVEWLRATVNNVQSNYLNAMPMHWCTLDSAKKKKTRKYSKFHRNLFALALVCYTPRKGLASWRNV